MADDINKEGINLIRVTAVLVGTVLVAGIGWKVSKFLGIIPDFSDDRFLKNKAVTPQLYLDNTDKKNINGNLAMALASRVYDAKGTFNDNEETLYGSLEQAGSQVNLSYVAYLFYSQYQEGMARYIDDYTSASEKKELLKIVNRLPKF